MSDSEHSTVIYTSISSDDGSLDVGSPGVIVLGYDGLPMMLEDPYAYVEAVMQELPPPDFVPEHVYPKFMPPEDDVLLAEEQPLPTAVTPTVDSPGYITESNPKEDPEKEDDEDPKEDPADYPTNRDDDEEEEEESSRDDANDVEEDEGKDEEEEEYLASADSVLPPAYRTTARMSIRAQTPIPFPSEAESTYDPLRARVTIYFPTIAHTSQLLTPPSGTPPLLPVPLPTSSPPLLLPSTDCRADVPEVTLPPRKRLCIAPGPRYEFRECSSAPTARSTRGFGADYDEIVEEIPATDVAELGQRMADFFTTIRQDTDEIYGRLDDAQDDRLMMSGQLNLLVQSMDASDTMHFKVRALWTMVLAQQTEIGDLRAVDRRRQAQLAEALTLLRILQTQMAVLQSQQRPTRDLSILITRGVRNYS
ncbi:hypothetical protein Tco_1138594 [Tanacetum coccineum]